ncbi:MAG: flagellar basal-body rod protein FlgF [Acidobacteria bacterium]|nr:flagellar basal-body rod protein FlgF [Acidobacteriota bacterium]
MQYGLYTAYLGMRARLRTLEVIANNVANASTTGYKADALHYRSVEAAELETARRAAADPAQADAPSLNRSDAALQSVRALGVTTGSRFDFSNGTARQTGRTLDVALEGDGLLVVQTPRGERYTRDGSLTLDANGQLVTAHGDLVVGEAGPITIRPGEVSISEDGLITSAGQEQGRLKVVRFDSPGTALLKESDSLFVANGGAQPQAAPQTRLHQGMLEASNVNPVGEMALMLQNNREFESLQRSVTQLMSMRKIATEIGKI